MGGRGQILCFRRSGRSRRRPSLAPVPPIYEVTGLRRDLRTTPKRHIVRGRGRGGDRYAPTPTGVGGLWILEVLSVN